MKTLALLIVSSMFVLFGSGCTVIVDKEARLASSQIKGGPVLMHGYTHRSGVWITNPDHPNETVVAFMEVRVRIRQSHRYSRDRYGYSVYGTPCPPDTLVKSSREYRSEYPGQALFVPSPTIVMRDEYVLVHTMFIDQWGNRTPGQVREFNPGNGDDGWGFKMEARKAR